MTTASLTRNAARRLRVLVMATGLLSASGASGGSIFDENYVPPVPKASAPVTPPAVRPSTTPAVTPTSPTPIPTPPIPPGPGTGSGPAPAETRLAIPAPAEQARSRKLLKEAFADDLKDRSPAARRALAAKLLKHADQVGDNPSDRFVVLVGACDAAAESGDLRLAGRAAGVAASLYVIDPVRLSADVTLKSPLKVATPAQAADDVQVGLEWANALARAEDYVAAAKLLAVLEPLAGGDKTLRSRVKEREGLIAETRLAHDRALAATDRLAKAPDDPVANSAIAEYRCFIAGDYEHGLPYLAKSGDKAMHAAAQHDMDGATAGGDQVAIGDQWWDLSNTQGRREIFKAGMRQRAALWYQKAIATGQVTGLSRTTLEKRIASASLESARVRTIDLLTLFDPKNSVAGNWSLDTSGTAPALVVHEGNFCRVQFAYQPPEEYDLRATFVYTTKGGPVILMCPLSEGAIMWYLEFNRSGFQSREEFVVKGKPPFITKGQPFTSVVKVRKDTVQGYLNDRLVCEFDRRTQPVPALSSPWKLPDPNAVGIGVWNSETTFSSILLVEVSGPGKQLR